MTLATQQKRKGGYVYQDYRPGAIVYHFTNLVVGINIRLHTLLNKNRSHVWYFLPHIEHTILMDTIGSIDHLDGLPEWVHCQVFLDCKVWLDCQVHYLTFKVHAEAQFQLFSLSLFQCNKSVIDEYHSQTILFRGYWTL